MKLAPALLVAAAFALGGCDALDEPQRLIAELGLQGLPAEAGTEFNGLLLGADGVMVCVGPTESIAVYMFGTSEAARAAADTVDPRDPSHVGNGIAEWAGPPRFWLRDDIIVLYTGGDADVDKALRQVLGPPFAESQDPGRGRPGEAPPCQRAGQPDG